MKKLFFIVILIGFCSSVFAQKKLQKADDAYTLKDYSKAISLYKVVIEKEKEHPQLNEIYFKIAESYRLGNNYKEALDYYSKAIQNNTADANAFYWCAEMLLITGNPKDALNYFQQFEQKQPQDSRVKNKIESCNIALKPATDSRYKIENVTSLNSRYSDFGIAKFKNKIVFASSRFQDKDTGNYYHITGQGFSDFYESAFDNSNTSWKAPVLLKGGVNSKFNDGTFYFDEKRNTAIFMQCNGYNGKELNCSLFTSTFDIEKNSWTESKLFDFNSKEFSIGHPAMTGDGNRLFFVADMPGGIGGKDIWYITKNENGQWSNAVNPGQSINTAGDELFPYISGDSILLYSSNGLPGYGGLDIYKSKIKNTNFSKPECLQTPFNSSSDDFGLIYLGKDSGFFCSNRMGGLGDDDIYSFSLIPVIITVSGVVKDKDNKSILPNTLIILRGGNNYSDTTLTDSKGFYKFEHLKPATSYVIFAQKDGYLGDSKTLTTEEKKVSKDYTKMTGFDFDFYLMKITKEEVDIPNIYYDFDKWDLRELSKNELDKVTKILKENKEIKIQINSHTDARGTDEYNKKLSDNRAQSVVNYFVDKGIKAHRLTYKGWGKSKLIKVDAQTDEEHQMNRRTTFNIVNVSEVSSEYTKAKHKKIEERIKTQNEIKNLGTVINLRSRSVEGGGVIFTVQFCAIKKEADPEKYEKITENVKEFKVVINKDSDGIYRHTIGMFKDYVAATKLLKTIKELGFEDAFIVAFKDGERISIKQAKVFSGD